MAPKKKVSSRARPQEVPDDDECSDDDFLCNSEENIHFLDLPISAHSLMLIGI